MQSTEKFNANQFRQLLKAQGFKSTRQRDEIVRVFMESDSHLSVDELYQKVRRKNPRIGYATVYRTLRLMAKSGLASSRQFGDGMARFEHQTQGEHHDHLICMSCGKIFEFESAPIEALQYHIALQKGFRIFDHKLELYGTCSQCASQERLANHRKKRRVLHD
jgi:Fur family transcriptional regulator, ferric uptake regulator